MNGFQVMFATCGNCGGGRMVSNDPGLAAHVAWHDSGQCRSRLNSPPVHLPPTPPEGTTARTWEDSADELKARALGVEWEAFKREQKARRVDRARRRAGVAQGELFQASPATARGA